MLLRLLYSKGSTGDGRGSLLSLEPLHSQAMKKERISFAASQELHKRKDAELLLTKVVGWDVEVIRFSTRKALEAFNKKAGLRPVIFTQVPLNCVVHKHESDSVARSLPSQP